MKAGRLVRGFSGLITGGLAMLVVVLVGAWIGSAVVGAPGPGPALLIGHALAAGMAAMLQRVADRRAGRAGLVAAGGVVLIAALVGLAFWWD